MLVWRGFALLLATLLIAGCSPEPRRAVRPAPPGPLDLIRGLWGDNSGRCPRDYAFCKSRGRSICCPDERGCCEDAGGAYCCSSRADRDGWDRNGGDDDRRQPRYTCALSEITCSHEGRTICCSSGDHCCAGEGGPYCCAPDADSRGRYPE
jgi:hypothetical protein